MPARPNGDEPRICYQRGVARVWLAGRWRYLGPEGAPSTRAEYDRVVAEWRAMGSPTQALPPRPKVIDLAIAYMRWYRDLVSYSRFIHARRAVSYLVELYGEDKAAEFGPRSLARVRDGMARSGLARKTINGRIAQIQDMFRWGVEQEIVPVEVHQALKCVRSLRKRQTDAPESVPVLPVREHALAAVLRHVTPTIADMIQVQLLTGCRPGEVCALTTGDIDMSGEVWIATLAEHKTAHLGKAKKIAIGPKAQAILLPRLRTELDRPIFCPQDSLEEDRQKRRDARRTPEGPNRTRDAERAARRARGDRGDRPAGLGYTSDSYRRAISRACDAAFPPPEGLDAEERRIWRQEHRWSPHQLRHARATEIAAAHGIERAAAVLGDGLTAARVYAERNLRAAIEIAKETG